MANYAGRWTVSQDAGFQQRACIAATAVAVTYTNEQAAGPEVDRKRRALALTVFADPAGQMERFAIALASQDVALADLDETILTKTFELWDGMAGINVEDYPTP